MILNEDYASLEIIDQKICDWEIVNCIRGRGGYYSPLFIIDAKYTGIHQENTTSRKLVVKQWGKSPNITDECGSFMLEDAEIVIRDMQILRNQVSQSGLKVPQILGYTFVPDSLTYEQGLYSLFSPYQTFISPDDYLRIIMAENYGGSCLRDLSKDTILKILPELYELMSKIPEGIPIDCHPGNFTWDNEAIHYIDFMPPQIWQYQDQRRFNDIFPTIKAKSEVDEEQKKYHYLTHAGRLERFNYYLNKWISSI